MTPKDFKPDALYRAEIKNANRMFTNADEVKMFRYAMNHCTATVAVGEDANGGWATVYDISTLPPFRGRGECQKLLKTLKDAADRNGRRFRLWCPMNKTIEHICQKLAIQTC